MANNGGVYTWSQTANSNAGADSTVNWAEGQAPSTVNNSARAMMASVAKWRDDISGSIVTTGTSTAYNVASNQVFDSLADMNGQMVVFTPHVTCGATVTLNVDSLGAKPLRLAPTGLAGFPNVELQTGTLIQGTPYAATYNNTDGAFYLRGFFNLPYEMPVGSLIDYAAASSPNSNYALCYGQAISRTAYSVLFSLVGTSYGSGDGSTTFNIPDLRGRFVAYNDNMGGTPAGRLTATYFGTSATVLGATGGSQSHTLSLGELPTGISSSGTNSITVSGPISGNLFGNVNVQSWAPPGSGFNIPFNGTSSNTWQFSGSNSINVTSNNTSGNPHAIVPPSIILNKLMRII